MTPQQFSKRIAGVERFTVEEFGLLADHLSAPPGWPFVPWALGSALFKRH